MKRKNNFLSLLVLVITIFTAAVAHAGENGEIDFNKGIKAFDNGNYVSAKNYFEKAKSAGLDRAALYFNLGVTYYKLHEYSKSREAFNRSAQYKQMRALSYYNLGLVAEKMSNRAVAESWFQKAYNGNNAKVSALAAIKLNKTRKKTTGVYYWAVVNAAIGYDDNLIDPASGTGNTQGSFSTDYYLAYGGPFSKNKNFGVAFDVSAYLSRYQNLSAYNYNLLHAGVSQPFVTGVWADRMGVQFEQSTLGGRSYQRASIFELRAKHETDGAARYELRYKARFVRSLNTVYNYLQGWQQQFIADTRFGKNRATELRYTYEINNRDDLSVAGTFASYSPTRNNIEISRKMLIKKGLKWRASIGYRISDYPDANIFTNGSRRIRNDDRTQFALGLIKQLTPDWRMKAEYQYTDNNSNIASYAYHRNYYRVNIQGLF